jgi:hypothetical protein
MNSTRWFDENDNEIIRENISSDEMEQIAEVGGSFEEFSVGLNFYSKSLDRMEITNCLGAKPTKAWNANEKHPIGNAKRSRITDWGKWYFKSKRDKTDLNTKLEDLLATFTNDLEKWKLLTTKYESWIDVAGYMDNWNRGFTLKPSVMKLIADRNLEIVFDIYHDEDVYEETTTHNNV